MACPDENTLAAFLEGSLSSSEGARVEAHLDLCQACRALVSLLAPSEAPGTLGQGVAFSLSEGAPAPPLALSRRFEIVRELGSGSMGTVYEAREHQTACPVALKVLRSQSPSELLRFKRAYRAVAPIRHPHLVGLHELGWLDLGWYFTMDLVTGTDLLSYVEACPSERETRLRRVLVGLLEGLMALHRAGKVHRDVKPSNVMVTPGGHVVVLDFGLVADVLPDLRPGPRPEDLAFAGTVAYMAPEQAASRPPSTASDLYAVGAILYQALTGRPPFSGDPYHVLYEKQEREPEPPSARALGVPPDLDALCTDLVRLDPARRPDGLTALRRLHAARPDLHEAPSSHQMSIIVGSELVGRTIELQSLRSVHADARAAGSARWVLVSGPSGIGKTALVHELHSELSRADPALVVLRGRCREHEQIPYNALDGVMDELSSVLGRWTRTRLGPLVSEGLSELTALFPVLARLGTAGFPLPELHREGLDQRGGWEATDGSTDARDPAERREPDTRDPAERREPGTRDPAETRDPGTRDPAERRAKAFGLLGTLFVRLAQQVPLVVSIDDLQWADADSLELLSALARATASSPILYVTACRSDAPKAPGLTKWLHESWPVSHAIHHLELAPLSHADTIRLAESLLCISARDRARTLELMVGEARGNPFYLRHLAQYIAQHLDRKEEGLQDGEETGWSAAQGTTSISAPRPSGAAVEGQGEPAGFLGLDLDRLIGLRLGSLPEPTRLLLGLVCVAGEAVPRAILRQAADLPPVHEHWVFGMADLAAQGLVREQGLRESDLVESHHDRIREHVTRVLPEPIRADHHRSLALAYETLAPTEAEHLTRHWTAAGESDRALHHARLAAQASLGKLAFDRAAQLLRSALSLARTAEDRVELGEALGDALVNAGRPAEAAMAYEEAANEAARETARETASEAASETASGVPQKTRMRLLQKAARQWLTGGYLDQGAVVLREVTATAGVSLPRTSAAALRSVLWHRLKLGVRGRAFTLRPPEEVAPDARERLDLLFTVGEGFLNVDVPLGVDFFTRHLLLALDEGDPADIAAAWTREAVGRVAVDVGKIPWARERLERAAELARAAGNETAIATCLSIAGTVELYAGQWDEAIRKLLLSEKHLVERCHGVQYEKSSTRWFLCLSLCRGGRLRELDERLARYIEDAARAGDRFGLTNYLCFFNPLWLVRDDPARADLTLAGQMDFLPRDRYTVQSFMHTLSVAERLLYTGRGRAAWEAVERDRARLATSQLHRNAILQTARLWLLARAALASAEQAAGPSERALFVARATRQALALRAYGLPYSRAWAALVEAGLINLTLKGASRPRRLEANDRSTGLVIPRIVGQAADRVVCRAIQRAAALLDAAGCRDVAAAARRHLGLWLGGGEGTRLVSEADAFLGTLGVANPTRFSTWLAQGFR